MMYIVRILLMLFAFTSVVQVCAQQSSDYNARELIAVYKKERSDFKNAIKNDRCWYVKYTYTSLVYDRISDKMKETVEHGELAATSFSRQVLSDDYQIFIDSNDMISIDKKRKIIMHTKAIGGVLDVDNIMFNRDILDDSTLRFYYVTKFPSANGVVIYNVIASDKESCLFEQVTFHYNPSANLFTKVQVRFNPALSQNLMGYTIQIHERAHKSTDKYYALAKDFILNKQGILKEEYRGYKYKNMTK